MNNQRIELAFEICFILIIIQDFSTMTEYRRQVQFRTLSHDSNSRVVTERENALTVMVSQCSTWNKGQ
jgi:hypothetical protein